MMVNNFIRRAGQENHTFLIAAEVVKAAEIDLPDKIEQTTADYNAPKISNTGMRSISAAASPAGIINMASELVNSATSDKLTEMDWVKNIEICELVAHDHRQAKEVVKAIKKCLGSKNSNTQLLTVLLLEMLMNNIGEHVHQQVIDTGVLPILVKIVKKKSDLPVGEKIFLLLDASQTSLGGNSGRFPQYYSAYCELVSAGVQFPQGSSDTPKPHSASDLNKNNSSNKQSAAPQFERKAPQTHPQNVSGSSILQKAGTALEVLRDVLTAVDTQHSEGAKDEFTLDLVEQCSFHKQQVMHLAMTSRDDKVVTRAIELNEKLERILQRHDALISGRTTLVATHIDHEQEGEEEEAEQLLQRIRKGKACLRPEEEDCQRDWPLRLKGHSVPAEMLHGPLIRPTNCGAAKARTCPATNDGANARNCTATYCGAKARSQCRKTSGCTTTPSC
ncbi:ENTH/VHS/GAT family protein [Abeliophyllum distichum]|uniref:ENTH/VHS/GAT family protein n=1 Tax=Abeliophyllum distichum TaxID=126358 RepID=A0ABD1SCU3_9LAMI